MMSLAIAVLALSGAPEAAPDSAGATKAAAQSSPAAETAASQSARQFLALVDAGNWPDSWAATAQSFRALNSVEAWQSVSQNVRVPLGRMLSRSLAGEESVPAPPAGYRVVRFRTRFANASETTETLSLVHEGEGWRVSGYRIER